MKATDRIGIILFFDAGLVLLAMAGVAAYGTAGEHDRFLFLRDVGFTALFLGMACCCMALALFAETEMPE